MTPSAVRTVVTPTHGRFLVEVPTTPPPHNLLVGFHGYGENAERHLEQLRQIPGASGWLLVAVQALHRFYNSRQDETVACWMTRQDRDEAISDNLTYIDRVLDAVRTEYRTGTLVFAGFSQGVAMAYRAALLGLSRPDGLIALGGDFPPELAGRQDHRLPPVLIGRGVRDTWYTEQRLQADAAALSSLGVSVRSVVVDAGHEWNDEFRAAAGEFLQHVTGAQG